jgi:hypothetical protein
MEQGEVSIKAIILAMAVVVAAIGSAQAKSNVVAGATPAWRNTTGQ